MKLIPPDEVSDKRATKLWGKPIINSNGLWKQWIKVREIKRRDGTIDKENVVIKQRSLMLREDLEYRGLEYWLKEFRKDSSFYDQRVYRPEWSIDKWVDDKDGKQLIHGRGPLVIGVLREALPDKKIRRIWESCCKGKWEGWRDYEWKNVAWNLQVVKEHLNRIADFLNPDKPKPRDRRKVSQPLYGVKEEMKSAWTWLRHTQVIYKSYCAYCDLLGSEKQPVPARFHAVRWLLLEGFLCIAHDSPEKGVCRRRNKEEKWEPPFIDKKCANGRCGNKVGKSGLEDFCCQDCNTEYHRGLHEKLKARGYGEEYAIGRM